MPPWAWSAAGGWQLAGQATPPDQALAALFKPLLDRGAGDAPWVIGQLGQSLDGFVATRSGDSDFVNGPENLDHLHRLRALCDAVIVGAGTVAADDPLLTTRRVSGPNPTRVLLDPQLRLDGRAQVLRNPQAPALWLCDARHAARAQATVGPERVLAVDGLLRDDGRTPELAAMVSALHARGLSVLFVEGGGVTVSRCLEQRVLQRLHVAVAPVLIGNGRPGLRFNGPVRMADCLRPPVQVHPMGGDQLWDLDLAASPRANAAVRTAGRTA